MECHLSSTWHALLPDVFLVRLSSFTAADFLPMVFGPNGLNFRIDQSSALLESCRTKMSKSPKSRMKAERVFTIASPQNISIPFYSTAHLRIRQRAESLRTGTWRPVHSSCSVIHAQSKLSRKRDGVTALLAAFVGYDLTVVDLPKGGFSFPICLALGAGWQAAGTGGCYAADLDRCEDHEKKIK